MEPTVHNRKNTDSAAKAAIANGRVSLDGLRAVDERLNDIEMSEWLMERAARQRVGETVSPPHLEEVRQLIINKTFEIGWGLATVRFGREAADRAFSYILRDAELLMGIRDEVFEAERLPKEWVMVERREDRGVWSVVVDLSDGRIERVSLDAVADQDGPAIVTTMHEDKEVMVTAARFAKWTGWSCDALLVVDGPAVEMTALKASFARDPAETWRRLEPLALTKTASPVTFDKRGIGFLRLAASTPFPAEELLLVVGLRRPELGGRRDLGKPR